MWGVKEDIYGVGWGRNYGGIFDIKWSWELCGSVTLVVNRDETVLLLWNFGKRLGLRM